MKEKFNQIEMYLKSIIEDNSARFFSTPRGEYLLAERIVDLMRAKTQVLKDGTLLAPNTFSILVNPEHAQDIRTNHALIESLATALHKAGNQTGIKFADPPTISVIADNNVLKGEFHVNALEPTDNLPETKDMGTMISQDNENIPPRAFLIVGGAKVFSLKEPVVNIGRRLENQLVIDDPRISRTHAQLRAVKGHYVIFDLDSSGGTFVNGEKINRAVLQPGDVVSLAGVPLVFGQDAVKPTSNSQAYKPPSSVRGEHTTRNIPLDDLDLDTFQE
jgi:hypothetical protein